MQALIFKNKNRITLMSAILIIIAFVNHYGWSLPTLSESFLIVASLIGILPIALQAYQALRVKVVSIDVLVTLAVLGAFYIQNFEESAIVTFLFLFGAYLEQRTLNKTRNAIKELTELVPDQAYLEDEHGQIVAVEVDEVAVGDIVVVKTGGKVPVDGRVISGEAYINEASITGESLPVSKQVDAHVYAGTLVENGTLRIQTDTVGEDTTFGKIIELLEEAQDSKSEAERFIDHFSKYYTPLVLALGILVGLLTQNIELAVTILVLGCPGALVIGVPVSNVAGIGNGAKHGVLLKGSEVIHDFSRVNTVIFDKTGTLTMGKPQVVDSQYYQDKATVDRLIATVENESDHPLGEAMLAYVGPIPFATIDQTEVVKGGGIIAQIQNHKVAVGNLKLMQTAGIPLSPQQENDLAIFADAGNSLVIIAIDQQIAAIFGIRDQVRDQVKEEMARLKQLGVKNLVVLSGDHQKSVDVVAKHIGLTEAHGNMLPEDKAAYIKRLKDQGQIVAFVGDGINDSPSLATADIGIAMGNGTDVAIETSDIVLMNDNITRLSHALGLTKATATNMKENIIIAILVVITLIASVFLSEWMNMSIGMLVHEASILVVILNGMRLTRYHLQKNFR